MEESIFFNRGNAVASNVDLKVIYEEVQLDLDKDKNGEKKEYVIVKKKNGSEYILYDKNSFVTIENRSDYEVIEYIYTCSAS